MHAFVFLKRISRWPYVCYTPRKKDPEIERGRGKNNVPIRGEWLRIFLKKIGLENMNSISNSKETL